MLFRRIPLVIGSNPPSFALGSITHEPAPFYARAVITLGSLFHLPG
jgi:hypothetical protein